MTVGSWRRVQLQKNLPVSLAHQLRTFIIATQDNEAFYSFKVFAKYKQACITPQLLLPLIAYVLRNLSCLTSILIGVHNSCSVSISSYTYTARSTADLHISFSSGTFPLEHHLSSRCEYSSNYKMLRQAIDRDLYW